MKSWIGCYKTGDVNYCVQHDKLVVGLLITIICITGVKLIIDVVGMVRK